MQFETILPFLRPIEHLILDPDISEIMVNADSRIFIERNGELEAVNGIVLSEQALYAAVKNIALRLGDDISETKPILDSRLPDGSRVAAIIPPCSIDGITLTIRKFNTRNFRIADLIANGTLTKDLADSLRNAVIQRKNILVSGGTGAGKTTLLSILADFIPDSDRVVLIEDTAELNVRKDNLVRFEARREQGEIPSVTIRELLKAALRHRPDRIIVGEIRGGEAFDLLQALNTGHAGSISTLHANSARQALSRFVDCVLQSKVEIPHRAIRSNIASSVDLLVHIARERGKRVVAEVLETASYSAEDDEYQFRSLYER
jgi:pilus assembly protein CpaF